MWSKILVPLDGSPEGDRLLAFLSRILERQCVLANLDESAIEIRLLEAGAAAEDFTAGLHRLEESARKLGRFAGSAVLELVSGMPEEEVLKVASRWGPGLIALAGQPAVAEHVLEDSTHPMLLANALALDATEARGALPFQRILAPVTEMQALERSAELARLFDAELLLLCVLPAELDGGLCMAELHEGALAGVRARWRLEYGPAVRAILQAAVDDEADLLVLTGQPLEATGRVVRGAPCPLLVEGATSSPEKKDRAPAFAVARS